MAKNRIFGLTKVGYCELLRADLHVKVLPLDSPFRVLLDGAVLFDSETYPKLSNSGQNTKAIALVFWPIF